MNNINFGSRLYKIYKGKVNYVKWSDALVLEYRASRWPLRVLLEVQTEISHDNGVLSDDPCFFFTKSLRLLLRLYYTRILFSVCLFYGFREKFSRIKDAYNKVWELSIPILRFLLFTLVIILNVSILVYILIIVRTFFYIF